MGSIHFGEQPGNGCYTRMGWGWDYGIGGEFANLNTARSMIAAVGACPSAISKKLSCPGTWNTQKHTHQDGTQKAQQNSFRVVQNAKANIKEVLFWTGPKHRWKNQGF